MKDYYRQILNDVATCLTDEFDQNFERKAFFDKKWRNAMLVNRRGSLMVRTSGLRSSIQNPKMGANTITWISSKPFATIQNEGGEITVTRQMQKYFWSQYIKNGKTTIEAQQFKAMALKKIGSKIIIPERRFIGDHPEVRKSIERCADATFKEIEEMLNEKLKQK